MKTPSNEQLLAVCTETARAAGNHALTNLHRRGEIAQHFDHDVKLILDSECQRVAEQVIHRYFPDHAILGEEGIFSKEDAVEWIIDPIDGTANYTRDFPFWCCSVAVRYANKILAGCVFVPVLNECYTATADGPALCNGSPIHVSAVSTLGKAILSTGLTKDIDPRSVAFFDSIAPRAGKIRILGSAAIDLCHVACGRSDGYFEAGLYLWDVAAAGLIAERAGARCTSWPRDEEHGLRFLCTNKAIHNDVKQIIKQHFGGN
ncbi:MAG: inositol monophosphatase [Pontiellaceae bacterium]|jgi:myo-inositol-1(or 4)-monophosphatase|nr:inositol monophosphatase [Pontiellaceae bacterium]